MKSNKVNENIVSYPREGYVVSFIASIFFVICLMAGIIVGIVFWIDIKEDDALVEMYITLIISLIASVGFIITTLAFKKWRIIINKNDLIIERLFKKPMKYSYCDLKIKYIDNIILLSYDDQTIAVLKYNMSNIDKINEKIAENSKMF